MRSLCKVPTMRLGIKFKYSKLRISSKSIKIIKTVISISLLYIFSIILQSMKLLLTFIFLLPLVYIGLGQADDEQFIDPSIAKCMTVKCSAGFYCFHGRCIQIDYDCIDITCQEGQRCNKGQCIKQLISPKMQLCKPLGFNQQKYQCGPEQQERCKNTPAPSKTVCSYSEDGTSEEFSNECEACK